MIYAGPANHPVSVLRGEGPGIGRGRAAWRGCRLLALLLGGLLSPAALAAPPTLSILTPRKGGPAAQLLTLRGEVRLKRYPQDSFEPAPGPVTLARRDEIETRAGGAEIEIENGMVVELGEGTIIAVIGRDSGTDLFFLRGTLRARPGARLKAGEIHSVQIITPAGRMTLRGRDVRLRSEGTQTTVQVFDGLANVWGRGGVVLRSGQMSLVEKGQPPSAPRPLQGGAPAWASEAALHLGGELPPVVVLRWQPVPGAARYRLELTRSDEPGHPPVVLETEATRAELRDLRVGAYQARVAAQDEKGAYGEAGEARRVIVAGVAGLSGGALPLAPSALPRILTPTGLPAAVQVDGAPLGLRGVAPGEHRFQISIGGLSAEVAARVVPAPRSAPRPGAGPARPAAPSPRTAAPAVAAAPAGSAASDRPDTSRPPLFAPRNAAPAAPPAPAPPTGRAFTTAAPDATPDTPPPEDALLLGPSETPGGGVRSPWAGRLVQLRFEGTAAGAARLHLHGRATLRDGFGGEIGVSLLRAQLGGELPPGAGEATGFGNLSASLRTPALRREHVALQGIVSAVFPLGSGALDRALYEVPAGAPPVALQVGGGWRLEAAALLGLRRGRVSFMTQQGLTLRLSGGFLPGYEGGAMVQADALRQLRFLAFCQWHVSYLGAAVTPGAEGPDSGGAVGGGVEVLLPGPLGGARLALLGRAGIGDGGAAVYGRGAASLQVGYRFR